MTENLNPFENEADDHGDVLIAWKFPEYLKHERGRAWFISMGILGGLLLLYCFWVFNFLFAVILIMIVTILYLHHKREPETVDFAICEDGLEIGRRFYSYKDIEAFWVIYEPPEVKTLYFDFKGWRPSLAIPLENENPLEVREILLKYLEEDLEKEYEPTSDFVGRWWKL